MNCPKCGAKLLEIGLPSEGRYGASKRKKLLFCKTYGCGYEKEIIYGDKSR